LIRIALVRKGSKPNGLLTNEKHLLFEEYCITWTCVKVCAYQQPQLRLILRRTELIRLTRGPRCHGALAEMTVPEAKQGRSLQSEKEGTMRTQMHLRKSIPLRLQNSGFLLNIVRRWAGDSKL
jgi:hypothetical protein